MGPRAPLQSRGFYGQRQKGSCRDQRLHRGRCCLRAACTLGGGGWWCTQPAEAGPTAICPQQVLPTLGSTSRMLTGKRWSLFLKTMFSSKYIRSTASPSFMQKLFAEHLGGAGSVLTSRDVTDHARARELGKDADGEHLLAIQGGPWASQGDWGAERPPGEGCPS